MPWKKAETPDATELVEPSKDLAAFMNGFDTESLMKQLAMFVGHLEAGITMGFPVKGGVILLVPGWRIRIRPEPEAAPNETNPKDSVQ